MIRQMCDKFPTSVNTNVKPVSCVSVEHLFKRDGKTISYVIRATFFAIKC